MAFVNSATMRGLLALSACIDAIGATAGRIAAWLVLAACLVSAGNAAVRYLLSTSSNAWLEIQWYMFGAMIFLGAPYTLRRNGHVRVDLVYSALSDRGRLWVDAVGTLLLLLPATIYLTALSWPLFRTSFISGETSLNAGGLILWPIKLFLPLGFALLTLQGVSELMKRAAAITGAVALDTQYEKPVQ